MKPREKFVKISKFGDEVARALSAALREGPPSKERAPFANGTLIEVFLSPWTAPSATTAALGYFLVAAKSQGEPPMTPIQVRCPDCMLQNTRMICETMTTARDATLGFGDGRGVDGFALVQTADDERADWMATVQVGDPAPTLLNATHVNLTLIRQPEITVSGLVVNISFDTSDSPKTILLEVRGHDGTAPQQRTEGPLSRGPEGGSGRDDSLVLAVSGFDAVGSPSQWVGA